MAADNIQRLAFITASSLGPRCAGRTTAAPQQALPVYCLPEQKPFASQARLFHRALNAPRDAGRQSPAPCQRISPETGTINTRERVPVPAVGILIWVVENSLNSRFFILAL
jgi:hypothetical protein